MTKTRTLSIFVIVLLFLVIVGCREPEPFAEDTPEYAFAMCLVEQAKEFRQYQIFGKWNRPSGRLRDNLAVAYASAICNDLIKGKSSEGIHNR